VAIVAACLRVQKKVSAKFWTEFSGGPLRGPSGAARAAGAYRGGRAGCQGSCRSLANQASRGAGVQISGIAHVPTGNGDLAFAAISFSTFWAPFSEEFSASVRKTLKIVGIVGNGSSTLSSSENFSAAYTVGGPEMPQRSENIALGRHDWTPVNRRLLLWQAYFSTMARRILPAGPARG